MYGTRAGKSIVTMLPDLDTQLKAGAVQFSTRGGAENAGVEIAELILSAQLT